MLRVLVCVILVGSIAGCSTSGTAIRIGENQYQPTDPTSIVMLLEAPSRPHSVVALVEGTASTDDYLTKGRTETAALEAMKAKAAEVGAHAIVLTGKDKAPYGQMAISNSVGSAYVAGSSISGTATTVTHSMGWDLYTFSGTAIRYAD